MHNQYDTGVAGSTFGDFSDTAAQAGNLAPNYMRYEAAKASWRREQPNATPSEYEHAIAAIAHACGV